MATLQYQIIHHHTDGENGPTCEHSGLVLSAEDVAGTDPESLRCPASCVTSRAMMQMVHPYTVTLTDTMTFTATVEAPSPWHAEDELRARVECGDISPVSRQSVATTTVQPETEQS
jgi:hypothetical protein